MHDLEMFDLDTVGTQRKRFERSILSIVTSHFRPTTLDIPSFQS